VKLALVWWWLGVFQYLRVPQWNYEVVSISLNVFSCLVKLALCNFAIFYFKTQVDLTWRAATRTTTKEETSVALIGAASSELGYATKRIDGELNSQSHNIETAHSGAVSSSFNKRIAERKIFSLKPQRYENASKHLQLFWIGNYLKARWA